MLAAMNHPNIVGFRAAQRLTDGHLCLALEHCEASLYSFIQERVKPHGGCVSPTREVKPTRCGDESQALSLEGNESTTLPRLLLTLALPSRHPFAVGPRW